MAPKSQNQEISDEISLPLSPTPSIMEEMTLETCVEKFKDEFFLFVFKNVDAFREKMAVNVITSMMGPCSAYDKVVKDVEEALQDEHLTVEGRERLQQFLIDFRAYTVKCRLQTASDLIEKIVTSAPHKPVTAAENQ